MPRPRLLTPADAADVLGVALKTLADWRLTGRGPAYVRLGDGLRAPIRYPADVLDDWITAHTVVTAGAR